MTFVASFYSLTKKETDKIEEWYDAKNIYNEII